MTTDEAFSLFAEYGNVAKSIDELKQVWPMPQQLITAGMYAMNKYSIPITQVNEAMQLIVDYFLYNKPNNEWSQR